MGKMEDNGQIGNPLSRKHHGIPSLLSCLGQLRLAALRHLVQPSDRMMCGRSLGARWPRHEEPEYIPQSLGRARTSFHAVKVG